MTASEQSLSDVSSVSAMFVFHEGHYAETSNGGVQICSREYAETLQAAGFRLRTIEVPVDRRAMVRLKRKIWPNLYRNLFDQTNAARTIASAVDPSVKYVFLNQRSLGGLARMLRELIPLDCKIVVLSHGLESVDYLHQLRIHATNGSIGSPKTKLTLAQLIAEEVNHARYIDHVFCLAPFEVEIERWLGARSISYLPRVITAKPLDWKPQRGRIGFVGSLSHPPNAEGLAFFLDALQAIAPSNVTLRLVGGPPEAGHSIVRRFPIVQYLGGLDDHQLEIEARTWNCFVHPLFCYSRGCSTKLAVAIGWQIPIATTTMGCRGYTWREGQLPLADTPESLARLALEMLDPEAAGIARTEISRIGNSSPTVSDVANLIRSSLSLPSTLAVRV